MSVQSGVQIFDTVCLFYKVNIATARTGECLISCMYDWSSVEKTASVLPRSYRKTRGYLYWLNRLLGDVRLTLDYMLTADDRVSSANNIQESVYYSSEENRLYKLAGVNLFSTETAKALSMLFVHAEDDIFLFLDMVFWSAPQKGVQL